jgi:hypothetical protein
MMGLDYVAELYHFYTPAIRGAISHLTEIYTDTMASRFISTSKLAADKKFYSANSGYAAYPPITVPHINSNR